MTMPLDLVLVRHGESEGNVASKRSKAGDQSLHTPEFLARHSSTWRLTDLGKRQAEMAGAWIREQIAGGVFNRYYVSPYLRAAETAAMLDLPEAAWRMKHHLRERDWGDLDVIAPDERKRLFAGNLARREVETLFWRPSNGESIANVCETRVFRTCDTLHRECSNGRAIIVLHGETMWAFRITLENLSPQRYAELDQSDNPFDHIHNCQILHYTRANPDTQELVSNYRWMRSICPTDLSQSRNDWEPVVRQTYTNQALLDLVAKTPRLIAG